MRVSTILPLVSAAMLASSAVARPVSYIAFRDDADLAERALGDLQVLFDRDYFGEQLSVRAEPPRPPGKFPQRTHGTSMEAHIKDRKQWHADQAQYERAQKQAAKEAGKPHDVMKMSRPSAQSYTWVANAKKPEGKKPEGKGKKPEGK